MCVFVDVYSDVYLYMYVYMFVYVCLCVCLCVDMCTYVYMFSLCIHVLLACMIGKNLYTHLDIDKYVYVWICAYVYLTYIRISNLHLYQLTSMAKPVLC
jgi:hypothetical protein